MRVLLAIDGSAHSDAAVAEVATRPWPKGTSVRVLCLACRFRLPIAIGDSVDAGSIVSISNSAQDALTDVAQPHGTRNQA